VKSSRKKRMWTVLLAVCIVVFAACVGTLLWLDHNEKMAAQTISQAIEPEPVRTPEPTPAPAPEPEPAAEPEPEPEPELIPADVPIDFAYLKEVNPDIYGWLDLSCTGQEYPVLSNDLDADHYIHRDVNGKYASAGSLYSQSIFNQLEFNDPCTVIYGHNMANGSMFGKLQKTAAGRDLDDAESEGNYFTLYTPTKIERYRIYAQGVFSDQNILYYYDFADEAGFAAFFEDFTGYSKGVRYISTEVTPAFGDELVILSTCYSRDNAYRFLTIGVLVEKEGY